jgi:hypothetical protein
MGRDIEILCRVLPPPERWLDAVDPRLGVLGDLVEHGKADEGADVAEEVLAAGLYDIRPITVVLYASFLEDGLERLPKIFEVVERTVGENFNAIGPVQRRKSFFDKRISWLFETVADQLAYEERSGGDRWRAWSEGVALERLQVAAATASTLATNLAAGGYEVAPRALGRVATFLQARSEALSSLEEPAPAPAASPAAPAPAAAPFPSDGDNGRVSIAVSHEFLELCRRLKAFEVLVQKGRHDKAAIVAADLQRTIGDFDPRKYFPEMFAEFAALFSKDVEVLSRHFEQRDSAAWNALDQFYRVDLKAFVES